MSSHTFNLGGPVTKPQAFQLGFNDLENQVKGKYNVTIRSLKDLFKNVQRFAITIKLERIWKYQRKKVWNLQIQKTWRRDQDGLLWIQSEQQYKKTFPTGNNMSLYQKISLNKSSRKVLKTHS